MSTNPFITQFGHSAASRKPTHWRDREPGSETCERDEFDRWNGGPAPHQPVRIFCRKVLFASMVFLAVVFCVAREIRHTRELYLMSQRIATSEARVRQWQQRERLEEVRKARLLAELHRRQISAATAPPNHATRNLSMLQR